MAKMENVDMKLVARICIQLYLQHMVPAEILAKHRKCYESYKSIWVIQEVQDMQD